MTDTTLRLRSLRAVVLRAPIDTPVQTAFGTMHDRPMVLVHALATDGSEGWGEAWCNFPQPGAEHRARLVDRVLAPLACARPFEDPEALFDELSARTAVLALQSGEPGPFAQAIAGVDIAVWDLVARRAGLPLWRVLGGRSGAVAVYASGLNPSAPEVLAARCRDEGHRRFKLKVGFGAARDRANLERLRETLGADTALMVDANQAWTLTQALDQLPLLEPFALDWLEEPLRADRPWAEWQALCAAGAPPLAAGENLAGVAAFDAALATGVLEVLQPDLAKWGGPSGVRRLLPRIEAAGRRCCPHYLGGGIGLLASAHLLTLGRGDGLLEVDANPNPLRTRLAGPLAQVHEGRVELGDAPGLGIVPDLEMLQPWVVAHAYG